MPRSFPPSSLHSGLPCVSLVLSLLRERSLVFRMISMMDLSVVSWQDAWFVVIAFGLRPEDGGERWRCMSYLGPSARVCPTGGCGADVGVCMPSNS